MSKRAAQRTHAKNRTPHPGAPKSHEGRSGARKPNLLITIQERHRDAARREVGALLERIGVKDYRFVEVDEGMLGVRLPADDPKACVARLQPLLREDPLAFQHTHRWLPIEAWLKADRAALRKFGDAAQDAIGASETWKVELHRHRSALDRDLMINSLAGGIDNPHVDLDEADKTVALEIIGDAAAVSVLEPTQQLSVDRVLKSEFVRFEEVD